jgi:hypothetical protein
MRKRHVAATGTHLSRTQNLHIYNKQKNANFTDENEYCLKSIKALQRNERMWRLTASIKSDITRMKE